MLVVHLDVYVEVAALVELFSTCVAMVRFFTRVNTHVVLPLRRCDKTSLAHFASRWKERNVTTTIH